MVAVFLSAISFLRTWIALHNVQEHVFRLWLQIAVVERTRKRGAVALDVESVADFLPLIPRVVGFPFRGRRWPHVYVEALQRPVQRNEAWHAFLRQVRRYVGAVHGSGLCDDFRVIDRQGGSRQ